MSEVECYEAAACLHASQLCAACVRNLELEGGADLIDFYEVKRGEPCPVCGKPLIAAVGETEANYCWVCNKNLKQMEAEKKK